MYRLASVGQCYEVEKLRGIVYEKNLVKKSLKVKVCPSLNFHNHYLEYITNHRHSRSGIIHINMLMLDGHVFEPHRSMKIGIE